MLTYALEENIVMLFRTGAAVRMGWIQEASVRYTEVKHMTIKDMKTGQTATILKVGGEAALRQHFLDMGLIQGAEVTVIKYAPMGDPVELRIHGYELTIRLADAAQIEVSTVHNNEKQEKTDIRLIKNWKNL